MPSEHVLTAGDKWFLDYGRVDPVTKEPFQVGDTVVICANCKTVHLDATWGMVSTKCCAICERNTALVFSSFSQQLFQAKRVQKKGFRIKEKPIPFYQRILGMSLYPVAYCVDVLLPILTAVVLFLNLQPAIFSGSLPARAESVLTQFSAEMESKCSRLLESFQEITVESGGDLLVFSTRAAEKLENVKGNVAKARFSEKFRRSADKLQTECHQMWMKLVALWEDVRDKGRGRA